MALGARSGVSTVVLFHHSPRRTDEQLDAIAERFRGCTHPAVVVAVEGQVIEC